jgi:hypothetical protein
MTGGVHLAARGERERGTGSGSGVAGLRARSGAGPDWLPGVQFDFYSPLLLFKFCFLYFFQTLFKFESNQFKQLCKVSKIQNNHTEQ